MYRAQPAPVRPGSVARRVPRAIARPVSPPFTRTTSQSIALLCRAAGLTLATALALAACDGSSPSGGDSCADADLPPADIGYSLSVEPGAAAGSYQPHPPILIEGVRATAADPYVVQGYEISSDSANGIEIRDCEHVVVRGNYLHDCTWNRDPGDPYSQDEGYALLVGKSSHVALEDNLLERNKQGLAVHSSHDVQIRHNTIRTTLVRSSLRLERVATAVVAANLLEDNGVPEQFWAPGHRCIGIFLVRSADVEVRDNAVLRSTSDGISVGGQIDGGGLTTHASDWTGLARDVRIHNNLVLDNMEQGLWLVRARNLAIHHNTIRTGCFTHGAGVALDFDVDDSEVYANKVVTCLCAAYMGLSMSHGNHIHDNAHYSTDGEHPPVRPHDDPVNDAIKAEWAGIPYRASADNRVEDELHFRVGGALGQALEERRERADSERTWEERGWFSCEIEEGRLDQACVAAQAALGDQGVPAAYIVFAPLMPDPDLYVIDKGCP